MDNIGGIRRIWALDPDEYISAAEGQDGIFTLTLENDPDVEEISFNDETGRATITDQESSNGPIYGFEFVGRIPGADAVAFDTVRERFVKKQIIIMEDNNENFWCVGLGALTQGVYFSVTKTRASGTVIQDMHATSLQLSAQLSSRVLPCADPF